MLLTAIASPVIPQFTDLSVNWLMSINHKDDIRMQKKTIQHNTPIDALIAVTKRLIRYEDRYNMTSEEFYNRYCKGQTEDSEDAVEWANAYQHFIYLRRDLESKVNRVA